MTHSTGSLAVVRGILAGLAALAILQNGVDGILGESLFDAEAFEVEIVVLGVERTR